MLKVSSCSIHDSIFVEADSKCQCPVTGPLYGHEFDHGLGGHIMTTLSHGAEKAHSQISWRFHWRATQCAVTGLGPVSSKSLWTAPVSWVSWSREIFPVVASFHIQSHTIITMDFIWNCVLSYQWLSHILHNVRDNTSWNRQYRKQYS